jgi:hypothetical protein
MARGTNAKLLPEMIEKSKNILHSEIAQIMV